MRHNQSQDNITIWPAAPFFLRTVAWALFGLGGGALLLVVVAHATAPVLIPQSGSFLGKMRPDFELVVVDLPAHSELIEVSVKEGDKVEPGDVLFKLNYGALETERDRLNRQLLAQRLIRQCYLEWPVNPFDQVELVELRKSLENPEDQFTFDAAALECQLLHDETQANKRETDRQRDVLATRLGLLKDKLALITRSPSLADATGQSRLSVAYEAMSVALAQNLTEIQLREVEQLDIMNFGMRRREMLAKSHEFNEKTEETSGALKLIAGLLAEPQIRADIGGMITRVRDDQLRGRYQSPVPLIEMQGSNSSGFRVSMQMPAKQAARLKPDQAVEVIAIGLAEDSPMLKGKVIDIRAELGASQSGHLTVDVVLEPSALAALERSSTGMALHGAETAAYVQVSLTPTAFLPEILSTLKAATGQMDRRFSQIGESVFGRMDKKSSLPPENAFKKANIGAAF